MRERPVPRPKQELAGQLLLAHPAMKDGNFRRAVVLMSAHGEDGAMGVVLNRPLGRQLGELEASFALGPLAGVPIYHGGPVETKQLILAAWRWLDDQETFQLHFGIEPERAEEMLGLPGVTVRAFLGYAGWGRGQLENEMKHQTWFVSPVASDVLGRCDGPDLWRLILGRMDPELKLLADEPEDPELN